MVSPIHDEGHIRPGGANALCRLRGKWKAGLTGTSTSGKIVVEADCPHNRQMYPSPPVIMQLILSFCPQSFVMSLWVWFSSQLSSGGFCPSGFVRYVVPRNACSRLGLTISRGCETTPPSLFPRSLTLAFEISIYQSTHHHIIPSSTTQQCSQSVSMPSISEQRKRELHVKIQQEQYLEHILEAQRRQMEEIMAQMSQETRNQILLSTNAARAKRKKKLVASGLEEELQVQELAVRQVETLNRKLREEQEQWEAWSKP